MSVEFSVSGVVPADPEAVWRAWLDSKGHSAMTGSPAHVSAEVGGPFNAWDGYISGTNVVIEPPGRILQAWRTVEFAESDPDSRLEVIFEPDPNGTKITINHSGLPDHGMQYKDGWVESYFIPMERYFSGSSEV